MVRGVNEDGKICRVPNTRTLKCLNKFCGFTWAENMDEVLLRRVENVSRCPKCFGNEFEIVNYNFKGINC